MVNINNDKEIEIETFNVNVNDNHPYISLYSQVEFLRNELEEKNLLILTLIIQNHEVDVTSKTNSSQTTSQYTTTSEYYGDNDDEGDNAFRDNITEVTNIHTNHEILEVTGALENQLEMERQ